MQEALAVLQECVPSTATMTMQRYAKIKAELALKVDSPRGAMQALDEWNEAQRICDLPGVDEALRNFGDDPTGDNATCVVRAALRASMP